MRIKEFHIKIYLTYICLSGILLFSLNHIFNAVHNTKLTISNNRVTTGTLKVTYPNFHLQLETDIQVKNISRPAMVKPKFAYGFYAASKAHLKAALVNINRLKKIGSTPVDYVIYTNTKPSTPLAGDIHLIPYRKLPSPEGYYDDCMVKLLFFNMTDYQKIVYLDADSLIVKPLDVLFNLPSVRLASPLAYWEDEPCFTSALLVIEPDYTTWLKIRQQMDTIVDNKKADMDLLNIFYQHKLGVHAKTFPEVLILPGYFVVLSSHFRERVHGRNEKREATNFYPFPDVEELAKLAYVIHFSGQPKPWSMSNDTIRQYMSITKYFYDFNFQFKDEYAKITI